jgi:hypothetical protein
MGHTLSLGQHESMGWANHRHADDKDFDSRQIASDFSVETPSLSAIRTTSTKDFARILRNAWLRWTFTVISLNSS